MFPVKLKRGIFLLLLALFFAAPSSPAVADSYELLAEDADISGASDLILEPDAPPQNLGDWRQDAGNVAIFKFHVYAGGLYSVTLHCSRVEPGTARARVYAVSDAGNDAGQFVTVPVDSTGDWANYADAESDTLLRIPAGDVTLRIDSADTSIGGYLMNLRSVNLILMEEEEPASGSPDAPGNGQNSASGSSAGEFFRRLDEAGFPGDSALQAAPEELVGKWVDVQDPRDGNNVDIGTVDSGQFYSREFSVPFDFKWDDANKGFVLIGGALEQPVIGAIRVAPSEDGKVFAIVLQNDGEYLSHVMAKPGDLADVKVCSLRYDWFDWGLASQAESQDGGKAKKLKIASEIIALWKQYGEEVNDQNLLAPEALVAALDGYSSGEDGSGERRLFDVACEIAGVDFDSYIED